MSDDEIEVLFDEKNKTFHAFWRPPLAIGAGSTREEALRDLREAIDFCSSFVISSSSKAIGMYQDD